MNTKSYKYLDFFTVAFVSLLLLSNVIASKMVNWLGITGTAAMYLFPITYIFGDILVEVYGYARTRRVIWLGFVANVIMVLVFWYAISLPHPDFWQGQAAFASVLGAVPRMVLFSILGYWCGSFVNSFVLARMKEWMVKWDPNHKFLFIRTIGSTLAGEFVDSVIFILGAFVGIIPWEVVSTMVFVQWGVKCAIEALMTPITYIIVGWLKKAEGVDAVGADSYTPFEVKV